MSGLLFTDIICIFGIEQKYDGRGPDSEVEERETDDSCCSSYRDVGNVPVRAADEIEKLVILISRPSSGGSLPNSCCWTSIKLLENSDDTASRRTIFEPPSESPLTNPKVLHCTPSIRECEPMHAGCGSIPRALHFHEEYRAPIFVEFESAHRALSVSAAHTNKNITR